jgi:hypothetical protein
VSVATPKWWLNKRGTIRKSGYSFSEKFTPD